MKPEDQIKDLEKQLNEKDNRIEELEKALKKKDVVVKDEKANRGKARTIDYDVEVEATDKDRYHKTGEKFKVGLGNAFTLEDKGLVKIVEPLVEVGEGKDKKRVPKRWADKIAAQAAAAAAAKFLIFILFAFVGLASASAQGQEVRMKNPLYALITTEASDYIDTVTNTGTSYLQTFERIRGDGGTSTIQFVATKISGTVAGTVTLQGSVDGSNYVTAGRHLAADSAAAFAYVTYPTFTATNVASQTYVWVLQDSPFSYYRVSWTGSGTMSASFTARIVKH